MTDKRIRIMNEIIVGIRVIKMYAWEYAFKRVVTKLRKLVSFERLLIISFDRLCMSPRSCILCLVDLNRCSFSKVG